MKRWVLWTFFSTFSVLFLVSTFILGDYFLNSFRRQLEFDRLAQLMHSTAVSALPQQTPGETADSVTPAQPILQPERIPVEDPETGEVLEVLPEFSALYTMNNDIVGWLRIPGTSIDYPVMQTPDAPDYYLYRSFQESYSRHGCIYVREECDVAAPSDNLTIYGHRMGDGTMFNDLHKYLEEAFYKEHTTIAFHTLTQRRTYEILAVFRVSSSQDSLFPYHLFVDAVDEADFDGYIQKCKTYALYDTGVTAQYGDKLITLSTCEYSQENGRLVVVAKCIN